MFSYSLSTDIVDHLRNIGGRFVPMEVNGHECYRDTTVLALDAMQVSLTSLGNDNQKTVVMALINGPAVVQPVSVSTDHRQCPCELDN